MHAGYGGLMWTEAGDVGAPEYIALARPYCAAVAGRVVGAAFNEEDETYSLQYIHNASASAPTEVKVPTAVRYTAGFRVVIVPPGAATWKQTDANTFVITPSGAQPEGTVIAFTVSPASHSSDPQAVVE